MESGCTGVSKPEYWLHRAESIFPKSPVVFQLKEYLIKTQQSGVESTGQLDKLIACKLLAIINSILVLIINIVDVIMYIFFCF